MLILDDGQPGGAGNVAAWDNDLNRNNQFRAANAEHPPLQGGVLLVLGGTKNVLRDNTVLGNVGTQFNSGGIVLVSASAPETASSTTTATPRCPRGCATDSQPLSAGTGRSSLASW
ncbi:hypothetical protein ACFV9C_34945 [Kribbella sp. NPDC059898]|uniref:hypothetical protein n=1 Tax=Kribbella sp. NPDC059898 TaxID=3346995 RepID=UPI00364E2533